MGKCLSLAIRRTIEFRRIISSAAAKESFTRRILELATEPTLQSDSDSDSAPEPTPIDKPVVRRQRKPIRMVSKKARKARRQQRNDAFLYPRGRKTTKPVVRTLNSWLDRMTLHPIHEMVVCTADPKVVSRTLVSFL